MNQNNIEENNPSNCLKDLLSDSTEEAKTGEFKKLAETKLGELINGVDQEEINYRNGFIECKATWERQNEKICEIKKRLENCYNIECYQKIICKEVIQRAWDLKKKIRENTCEPQICLDIANDLVLDAQDQLEAWQKISVWIKNRLELNGQLIEEICKLDNCNDGPFAIYIFYFLLWPAHMSLKERNDEDVLPEEVIDPERAYCKDVCEPPDDVCKNPEKSCCKPCGYPWLIDPDKFNCKLARVWEMWKVCGIERVKKQCAVDAIETYRTDYEDAAKPEAKRDTARDALRRFGNERCSSKKEDKGNMDSCKE